MPRQQREHQEQVAIVQWANITRLSVLLPNRGNYRFIGEALVASGNGLHTSAKQAIDFKMSGCKAGFPDLQLCIPAGNYHGLFIELKAPALHGKPKGRLSDKQKLMMVNLNATGYLAVACWGYDEAINTIKKYLAGEL